MPDEDEFTPLKTAESQHILEEIRKQANEIDSLRARMDTTIQKGPLSEKATAVVVFERPDLLRLEFFATALNRLAALLISRGQSLQGVDVLNREVYRGTASDENFMRLLSLPFAPEEFMLWLTGRFFPPRNPNMAVEARSSKDGQTVMLSFNNRSNTKVLLLASLAGCSPESVKKDLPGSCGRLQAIEIRDAGDEPLFFATFAHQKNVSNKIILPSTISFWLAEKQVSGEIRFLNASPNVSLEGEKERLFAERTPAGAIIHDLDKSSGEKFVPFL